MFGLRRKARQAKADAAFAVAQEAYRSAVSRRDCRDQHTALAALVKAQTERLRLGVAA